jgi:hypothetical protein
MIDPTPPGFNGSSEAQLPPVSLISSTGCAGKVWSKADESTGIFLLE